SASCFVVDGTGTTESAQVTIDVSPPPVASASDTSTAAAPGTTITFQATGENGSGGFGGFAWSFGDGTHATGASATHGFGTSANFTVAVTLNDSNGARATASVVVDVSPIHLQ